MKKITRLTSIVLTLLIFVLALVIFAFLSSDGDTPAITVPEETVVVPTEDRVKPLGRSYFENGRRYFSFSGSGAEFSFVGEYAQLTLFCDEYDKLYDIHKPRYAIFLDGVKVQEAVLDSAEKLIRIDTADSKRESVITLIKQSEAKCSGFGLGLIKTYGTRAPEATEKKPLQIEFIGDSITCGYGIDETDINGGFSSATESFTGTYAYITAGNLDADFSAVAFSGYGVVTGYMSGGRKNEDAIVSKYYYKSAFLPDGREPYWDFSKTENDFVIINLGTNDALYCKGTARCREFTEGYIALLEQVRSVNPRAFILCILGDMNNSVYPLIEQAVEEYRSVSIDNRVEAAMISFDMGENDIVVNGHPGPLSNLAASEKLTNKINEIILSGK